MGNNLKTCCDPNDDIKTAAPPPVSRHLEVNLEVGGRSLPASDTEDSGAPEILLQDGVPPCKPPAIIKIQSEKIFDTTKPTDLESALSSNASDFTSPRESVPADSPDLNNDNHSETPVFSDNSEPPSLMFRDSLSDKPRKSGKQVSFANFAQVMEKEEVFNQTPRDLESPDFYASTPVFSPGEVLYTPSMKALTPHSVRSVQSMGELPSTPSMDNIYLRDHMEVKTNFYMQPTRTESDNKHTLHTKIQTSNAPMYIDSSPSVLDTLDVPKSCRSVGSLPPTPLLNNLFLAAAEAEGSEHLSKEQSSSEESEPRINVLYGMVESDSEESEATGPSSIPAIKRLLTGSDDETETSGCGGDTFGVSTAWFTTKVPPSPDSVQSYSSIEIGGEEMEI